MKKIYTLVAAALLAGNSFGQFIEQTNYKGAFGLSTDANWADAWTNWDPQNTAYGATTTTVSADITTNTTWTTGTIVQLKNKVYVTNNAILTIQPGVIIRGDKTTEATLIISRGSKLMAEGTQSNPIVFTSNFAAGSRAPGDWGGVILLGNAPANNIDNTTTPITYPVIEGGLDPVKAQYGGTNASDNSGSLKYVRIEFAGFPFQPDKEINGLTFGAVGNGTIIDNVQVSFSNDDSFEWFGGTVNCKHLIAYRGVDDDFDTDNGFSGKVQFGLALRDPNLADQCTCSTSESFESDNDATGSTKSPQTLAVFSNMTIIGPYRGSTSNTIDAKFRRAARIRRNSALSIFNSVLSDWPNGLHIDGTATETNAGDTTKLVFNSNVLAGIATGKNLQVNAGSTFDIKSFFTAGKNDSLATSALVKFVNAYPTNFNNPDFRLQVGSPLIGNTNFTSPKLGVVIVPTGIRNIETIRNVMVYPNPATNHVFVNFETSSNAIVGIRIMDLSGKTVKEVSENFSGGNHEVEINISELLKGFYFVNIDNGTSFHTAKLVVLN